MLKLAIARRLRPRFSQPPSGGCVLKLNIVQYHQIGAKQPPSGGCVLKHGLSFMGWRHYAAAAFGRLCVETVAPAPYLPMRIAAAFGRLCVETRLFIAAASARFAAAFGRLCVETRMRSTCPALLPCSRLRAAVC